MKRIAPLPHLRCHLKVTLPRIALTLLLTGCTATAPTRAHDAAHVPAALAARIDSLIDQPRFAAADWGIAVVSLDNGRTLYAHNADRLLEPASTAKLFTAALALGELDRDYRIPTRVLAGPIKPGGRLNGPLILYGMGDPTLGADATSADWADQLAKQLAAHGIRRIRGDLVADDSYFRGPPFGSGWEADDLQSWFAVPSSALSVQENVVAVSVSPGKVAGRPAELSFLPTSAMPPVTGQITTSAAQGPDDINLYRAPGGDTLHAFGSIAAGSAPRTFRLAVSDPAQLAGRQLLLALPRHGIRLDGRLRVVHWPQDDQALRANTRVVAEVLSPPLQDVLQRGLKRSQNLYLQNLLLLAGVKAQAEALQAGDPPEGFLDSERWGIRALDELLTRIGIPPTARLIEEGTGLSRRDLATPHAMVRLLSYLAAQPYADALREMLPIAGVDGSLQWRMRDTPAAGNVHAKTGSMTYVHCLAGYVTTAAGEHLAFAIMLNHYDAPDGAPRASQDVDAIAVLLASLQHRS